MITLVIPTIDRSDFIIKYLFYLNLMSFKGQVLLGDSSNQFHFNRIKNFIKNIKLSFICEQIPCPNLTAAQAVRASIPFIKFEYVTYICDDDILIVSTLKKCVKFLSENKDHSAVGGLGVCIVFKEQNYEKIKYLYDYKINEITKNHPIDRLNQLMNDYSVVAYALTRKSNFIERWPTNDNLNDKFHIALELLPCAIASIQGKIKFLDDLYVIRQIHDRRIILPSIVDQFNNKDWHNALNFAIEYSSEILKNKFNINQSESRKFSSRAWQNYIDNLRKIFLREQNRSKLNIFLNSLKSKIECYASYRKINSKSSVHYNNFNEVYRVLTSSSSQLIRKVT